VSWDENLVRCSIIEFLAPYYEWLILRQMKVIVVTFKRFCTSDYLARKKYIIIRDLTQ